MMEFYASQQRRIPLCGTSGDVPHRAFFQFQLGSAVSGSAIN
jgi:hypothetical protein